MSTRSSVIEAAEKYLFHGLVEHAPEKVPLAPDATRVEQGVDSGSSGGQIRENLLWDVMKIITGISNLRWVVDGDQAVAFYDLNTSTSSYPTKIAERFRVVDGLITEIEAIFYVPPEDGSAPKLD